MDLQVADRVAVVTGASKGIGLAITQALPAEGAYVIAGARMTDGLEGIVRVTPVAIALTASEAPAKLVQRAIDEHGRIDVLVSNVGAVRIRLDGFPGTINEKFECSDADAASPPLRRVTRGFQKIVRGDKELGPGDGRQEGPGRDRRNRPERQ